MFRGKLSKMAEEEDFAETWIQRLESVIDSFQGEVLDITRYSFWVKIFAQYHPTSRKHSNSAQQQSITSRVLNLQRRLEVRNRISCILAMNGYSKGEIDLYHQKSHAKFVLAGKLKCQEIFDSSDVKNVFGASNDNDGSSTSSEEITSLSDDTCSGENDCTSHKEYRDKSNVATSFSQASNDNWRTCNTPLLPERMSDLKDIEIEGLSIDTDASDEDNDEDNDENPGSPESGRDDKDDDGYFNIPYHSIHSSGTSNTCTIPASINKAFSSIHVTNKQPELRKSKRTVIRKKKVFSPSNVFVLPMHKEGKRYCHCQLIYRADQDPMVQCSDWKNGVKRKRNQCRVWYHFGQLNCVEYNGEDFWLCSECTEWKNFKQARKHKQFRTNDNHMTAQRNLSFGQPSVSVSSLVGEASSPDGHESGESDLSSSDGERMYTLNANCDEGGQNQVENEEGMSVEELCDVMGVDEAVLTYVPPPEFVLKFESKIWASIYNYAGGKLLGRAWGAAISHQMKEAHQVCSFNADRAPTYCTASGKPFIRLNGRCAGKNCGRTFQIILPEAPIPGEDVHLQGTSKGKFCLVQDMESGRQLRSTDRNKIKNLLRHEKSVSIFARHYGDLNVHELLHRNMPFRSRNVLRVAANEAKNELRADAKDPLRDVYLLREELKSKEEFNSGTKLPGLIHMISWVPFRIEIYTLRQIKLAATLARRLTIDLFLDATGGMCRSLAKEGRSVYYYALIARTRNPADRFNQPLQFVVAEFFSEANDQCTIQHFISRIVKEIHQCTKLSRTCEVVVSDFSFAMLHSISLGMNCETLLKYIRRSWKILRHESTFPETKSYIMICAAHLINAFQKNLSSKGIPKHIKGIALPSLARLHETESYEEFQCVVKMILKLFGNEFITSDTKRQLENQFPNSLFEEYKSTIAEMKGLKRSDDEVTFFLPQEDKKFPQREQSPFYQYFKTARLNLIANEDSGTRKNSLVENPYYNTTVLDVLQDTYIAYYPLWARSVLCQSRFPEFKRMSNAPVEAYFGTLKHVYHKDRNQHPGDFLRAHSKVILGSVNEALDKARRLKWVPREKEPKRKDTGELNELEEQYHAKEEWSKKTKLRQPKHLSANKSMKLPTAKVKQNSEQSNENISEIVFSVDNINGYLSDLCTALPLTWLNDMVINAYAAYLSARYSAEQNDIYVASSFLLTKISPRQAQDRLSKLGSGMCRCGDEDCHDSVHAPKGIENYVLNRSMLEYIPSTARKIILPFCDTNHWYVLEFILETHNLIIHNSLRMYIPSAKVLLAVFTHHFTRKFCTNEWILSIQPCQRQLNNDDYGVHALFNIECILQNEKEVRIDINTYRNYIIENLLGTTEKGQHLSGLCNGDFKRLVPRAHKRTLETATSSEGTQRSNTKHTNVDGTKEHTGQQTKHEYKNRKNSIRSEAMKHESKRITDKEFKNGCAVQ